MLSDCLGKIASLGGRLCFVGTNKRKIILILEKLVYKKCLPDPSSSAYDNKLGTVGFQAVR